MGANPQKVGPRERWTYDMPPRQTTFMYLNSPVTGWHGNHRYWGPSFDSKRVSDRLHLSACMSDTWEPPPELSSSRHVRSDTAALLVVWTSMFWERPRLFERSFVISHVMIPTNQGNVLTRWGEGLMSHLIESVWAEMQTEWVTLELRPVFKVMCHVTLGRYHQHFWRVFFFPECITLCEATQRMPDVNLAWRSPTFGAEVLVWVVGTVLLSVAGVVDVDAAAVVTQELVVGAVTGAHWNTQRTRHSLKPGLGTGRR